MRVLLDARQIMTTRKKTFTVTIPGARLRSGRHQLRFVATDRLGRTVRVSRTFTRCARPARQAPTFTG